MLHAWFDKAYLHPHRQFALGLTNLRGEGEVRVCVADGDLFPVKMVLKSSYHRDSPSLLNQ